MKITDREKTVYSIYDKKEFFTLDSLTYAEFFNLYFLGCLKADLADQGDVSTQLLHSALPGETEAHFIAGSSGVFSGEEEVAYIARKMGLKLRKGVSKDGKKTNEIVAGSKFKKGDLLFTLIGKPYKILEIERTLLNLLQRMCGIATVASKFKTKHTKVAVTRKTPLPFIDKRAAMDGGVMSHRINLSDAVMIKDTHLDQFGRDFEIVKESLLAANERGALRSVSFIEIEVQNQLEALKVAQMSRELNLPVPVIVMLDNFRLEDIKKTLKRLEENGTKDYVLIEVSGGITLKNYKSYDIRGIDVMSVGEITHSVKAVDIAMKCST